MHLKYEFLVPVCIPYLPLAVLSESESAAADNPWGQGGIEFIFTSIVNIIINSTNTRD